MIKAETEEGGMEAETEAGGMEAELKEGMEAELEKEWKQKMRIRQRRE